MGARSSAGPAGPFAPSHLSFRRDQATSAFKPLSVSLVTEVLGVHAANLLDEEADDALHAPRWQGHAGGDDPSGRPTPPVDGTDRRHIPASVLPEVTIRMIADRATAAPGETIVYTVSLTNASEQVAPEVQAFSHTPQGTEYVPDALCRGETLSMEEDRGFAGGTKPCVDPGPHAPHLTTDLEHDLQVGWGHVKPGETVTWRFAVRVRAELPPGTLVTNHAHATSGSERWNSETITVEVR